LLDAPMVEELDRWVEIVSVVAIATGEDAIEVLLDAATADRTGGCLAAVSSVMEPADAAAFASVVLERAEDPSDEQVGAAVELWVAAGALDRMEQLPGGLRAGMAAWVAADDVVDRARLVTAELPPAAAAPILGEAVERGASDPAGRRVRRRRPGHRHTARARSAVGGPRRRRATRRAHGGTRRRGDGRSTRRAADDDRD
jgi:hypothetical protein